MAAAPEFPPLEPSSFDLIVIGTGLPQSIVAAAVSAAGKSVLHLDPNPFYGSHFSSLSPPDLSSFLLSPPLSPYPSPSSDEYDVVPLPSRSLYSDVAVSTSGDLENPIKLSLDAPGPRVMFCADAAVELMVRAGVSEYLEFKSVDGSLIYDGERGKFSSVPDSRAAIFKDRSLSLTEKNQLMRFFKRVQEHLAGGGAEGAIPEEDLDRPFLDFLSAMRLPKKIQRIILYAIALADYDQEDSEIKNLLKTKDGLDRLALYHSSFGRFPNAQGAMLYPVYGHGELPQAFCRRAAVKGCIYVLRMQVTALLVEKGSGQYKGVRLASGQDLFSPKLIIDPQFAVPRTPALSLPDASQARSQHLSPTDTLRQCKVARGICISRQSLKSDASNLLIVYPPRSLYPEQATSIRALQLGGSVAVCPVGMFILHLSTLCDDASQGKKQLTAAVNNFFRQSLSASCETSSSEKPEETSETQHADTVDQNGEGGEQKPNLLWSVLYVQEIVEGSVDDVSICPSPDGNLSYNDIVDVSKKMFHQIYPDEEFFPEKGSSEDPDDGDGGGNL